MSLACAAVQRACGSLQIRRERLQQVRLRPSLLLCVRDVKRFIEDGIELDLAPPPVVVVLSVLASHKEPAVVHLPAATHDGYAGALGEANSTLLVVGDLVPCVDRQLRESDPQDRKRTRLNSSHLV